MIFFANLLSLFYGNETETEVLRQEVGALESYGGRLIPTINLLFAGPQNLLLLEREPEAYLMRYFQNDLGLTLPEMKTIPTERFSNSFLDSLRDYPAQWMNGYVIDQGLNDLAASINKKTIGSFVGSHQGNNKLLLYQFLTTKGLPVFDTLMASKIDELPEVFDQLKKQGYQKVVVKSQIGASGIGMQKVDLSQKEATQAVPEYLFFEGPCLVQGWLDNSLEGITVLGSPSVQLFVQEECVYLYDLTEQILNNESIHQGNVSPPPYEDQHPELMKELLRQAHAAAGWLYEQGYRGTASVDFHAALREGALEIRICEINARVTGATYPSVLARYFHPGGAWLMRNIRFAEGKSGGMVVKILKESELLYHPQKDQGILPINFNLDKNGNVIKGQFLFLGKQIKDTEHLLEELTKIENLSGGYDRD